MALDTEIDPTTVDPPAELHISTAHGDEGYCLARLSAGTPRVAELVVSVLSYRMARSTKENVMEETRRGPRWIMSVCQRGIAVIPRRTQPTVLALVLALVAWPIVALTAGVGVRSYYINNGLPTSAPDQWVMAGGGVFLSALVAGSIGGLAVRRNAKAGGLFTFVLALAVAIIGATLIPGLIRVLLGQENICQLANVGLPCDPIPATAHLIIDVLQSLPLFFLFAPFVEPVAVITLGLGVGLWTALLAPSSQPRPWVGGPERADRYTW